MKRKLSYSMVIVWSEEDDCYLVHLPDFPEQRFRTHGETYEEAAKNGQEVLELLLEDENFPPQVVKNILISV
ncbi:MAG: type II toxin-antitoxin system HicB family antitoxin [Microcystaceae cyanobacterium]